MSGELIQLTKNGQEKQRFPVVNLHVFIGSDSYCDLRIKHNAISPQHCLITAQKDKPALIRNLSRTAPTLLNGIEIGSQDVELKDQDIITIQHLQFKWCYHEIPKSPDGSFSSPNKGRKSWPLFNNKLVAVVTPQRRDEDVVGTDKVRLGDVEKDLPLKKRRATLASVSFPSSSKTKKGASKVLAIKGGVKGARKSSLKKSSVKISPSIVKLSLDSPAGVLPQPKKSVKFVDSLLQKSKLGKRGKKSQNPPTPYRPSNTPGKPKDSLYFTPPSTFGSGRKPIKSILKTPGSTSGKKPAQSTMKSPFPALVDLSTTPPGLPGSVDASQTEVDESRFSTPPRDEQLDIVMRSSKKSASRIPSPESTPKSASKAEKRFRCEEPFEASERAAKKLKQDPPHAIDKKKMAALLQCHRKSLTPHPEFKARRRILLGPGLVPQKDVQPKVLVKIKPEKPRKSEPTRKLSQIVSRTRRFGSLGHTDAQTLITKKRKPPFTAINPDRKFSLPRTSVAKMISSPSPPSRKMTRATRAARASREPREKGEVTDVLSALDLSRKYPLPANSEIVKKTTSPIADFTNVSGIKRLFSTDKTLDVRELFLEDKAPSSEESPSRTPGSSRKISPGSSSRLSRKSLLLKTSKSGESALDDQSLNSFNIEGVYELPASPLSSSSIPVSPLSVASTSRRSLTLKGGRRSSLTSRESVSYAQQSQNVIPLSSPREKSVIGNDGDPEFQTDIIQQEDRTVNQTLTSDVKSPSLIKKRGRPRRHSPADSFNQTNGLDLDSLSVKKSERYSKVNVSSSLVEVKDLEVSSSSHQSRTDRSLLERSSAEKVTRSKSSVDVNIFNQENTQALTISTPKQQGTLTKSVSSVTIDQERTDCLLAVENHQDQSSVLHMHTPFKGRRSRSLPSEPTSTKRKIVSSLSSQKATKTKPTEKEARLLALATPLRQRKPTRSTSSVNIDLFRLDESIPLAIPTSTPASHISRKVSKRASNLLTTASSPVNKGTPGAASTPAKQMQTTTKDLSSNESSFKPTRSTSTININLFNLDKSPIVQKSTPSAEEFPMSDTAKENRQSDKLQHKIKSAKIRLSRKGKSFIEVNRKKTPFVKASRSKSLMNTGEFITKENIPISKESTSENAEPQARPTRSKSFVDINLFDLDKSVKVRASSPIKCTGGRKSLKEQTPSRAFPIKDESQVESTVTSDRNISLLSPEEKQKKTIKVTTTPQARPTRSMSTLDINLFGLDDNRSFDEEPSSPRKGISSRKSLKQESSSRVSLIKDISQVESTFMSERNVRLSSPNDVKNKTINKQSATPQDRPTRSKTSIDINLFGLDDNKSFKAGPSSPRKSMSDQKSFKDQTSSRASHIKDVSQVEATFANDISINLASLNEEKMETIKLSTKESATAQARPTRSKASIDINLFGLDDNKSFKAGPSSPRKSMSDQKSFKDQTSSRASHIKDVSQVGGTFASDISINLASPNKEKMETIKQSTRESATPQARPTRSKASIDINLFGLDDNKSFKAGPSSPRKSVSGQKSLKDETFSRASLIKDVSQVEATFANDISINLASLNEEKMETIKQSTKERATPQARPTRSKASIDINLFGLDDNKSFKAGTSSPRKSVSGQKSLKDETFSRASLIKDVSQVENTFVSEKIVSLTSPIDVQNKTINKQSNRDRNTPQARPTRSTSTIEINLFGLDDNKSFKAEFSSPIKGMSNRKTLKQESSRISLIKDVEGTSASDISINLASPNEEEFKTVKQSRRESSTPQARPTRSKSSIDINLFGLDDNKSFKAGPSSPRKSVSGKKSLKDETSLRASLIEDVSYGESSFMSERNISLMSPNDVKNKTINKKSNRDTNTPQARPTRSKSSIDINLFGLDDNKSFKPGPSSPRKSASGQKSSQDQTSSGASLINDVSQVDGSFASDININLASPNEEQMKTTKQSTRESATPQATRPTRSKSSVDINLFGLDDNKSFKSGPSSLRKSMSGKKSLRDEMSLRASLIEDVSLVEGSFMSERNSLMSPNDVQNKSINKKSNSGSDTPQATKPTRSKSSIDINLFGLDDKSLKAGPSSPRKSVSGKKSLKDETPLRTSLIKDVSLVEGSFMSERNISLMSPNDVKNKTINKKSNRDSNTPQVRPTRSKSSIDINLFGLDDNKSFKAGLSSPRKSMSGKKSLRDETSLRAPLIEDVSQVESAFMSERNISLMAPNEEQMKSIKQSTRESSTPQARPTRSKSSIDIDLFGLDDKSFKAGPSSPRKSVSVKKSLKDETSLRASLIEDVSQVESSFMSERNIRLMSPNDVQNKTINKKSYRDSDTPQATRPTRSKSSIDINLFGLDDNKSFKARASSPRIGMSGRKSLKDQTPPRTSFIKDVAQVESALRSNGSVSLASRNDEQNETFNNQSTRKSVTPQARPNRSKSSTSTNLFVGLDDNNAFKAGPSSPIKVSRGRKSLKEQTPSRVPLIKHDSLLNNTFESDNGNYVSSSEIISEVKGNENFKRKSTGKNDSLHIRPTRSKSVLEINLFNLDNGPNIHRRSSYKSSPISKPENNFSRENTKHTQTPMSADYANNKHSQTVGLLSMSVPSKSGQHSSFSLDKGVSVVNSTSTTTPVTDYEQQIKALISPRTRRSLGQKEFDEFERTPATSASDRTTPLSALPPKVRRSLLIGKRNSEVKHTQTPLNLNTSRHDTLEHVASLNKSSQTVSEHSKLQISSTFVETEIKSTNDKPPSLKRNKRSHKTSTTDLSSQKSEASSGLKENKTISNQTLRRGRSRTESEDVSSKTPLGKSLMLSSNKPSEHIKRKITSEVIATELSPSPPKKAKVITKTHNTSLAASDLIEDESSETQDNKVSSSTGHISGVNKIIKEEALASSPIRRGRKAKTINVPKDDKSLDAHVVKTDIVSPSLSVPVRRRGRAAKTISEDNEALNVNNKVEAESLSAPIRRGRSAMTVVSEQDDKCTVDVLNKKTSKSKMVALKVPSKQAALSSKIIKVPPKGGRRARGTGSLASNTSSDSSSKKQVAPSRKTRGVKFNLEPSSPTVVRPVKKKTGSEKSSTNDILPELKLISPSLPSRGRRGRPAKNSSMLQDNTLNLDSKKGTSGDLKAAVDPVKTKKRVDKTPSENNMPTKNVASTSAPVQPRRGRSAKTAVIEQDVAIASKKDVPSDLITSGFSPIKKRTRSDKLTTENILPTKNVASNSARGRRARPAIVRNNDDLNLVSENEITLEVVAPLKRKMRSGKLPAEGEIAAVGVASSSVTVPARRGRSGKTADIAPENNTSNLTSKKEVAVNLDAPVKNKSMNVKFKSTENILPTVSPPVRRRKAKDIPTLESSSMPKNKSKETKVDVSIAEDMVSPIQRRTRNAKTTVANLSPKPKRKEKRKVSSNKEENKKTTKQVDAIQAIQLKNTRSTKPQQSKSPVTSKRKASANDSGPALKTRGKQAVTTPLAPKRKRQEVVHSSPTCLTKASHSDKVSPPTTKKGGATVKKEMLLVPPPVAKRGRQPAEKRENSTKLPEATSSSKRGQPVKLTTLSPVSVKKTTVKKLKQLKAEPKNKSPVLKKNANLKTVMKAKKDKVSGKVKQLTKLSVSTLIEATKENAQFNIKGNRKLPQRNAKK